MHKLNLEFTSQTSPAAHASSRLFSGGNKDWTRDSGGNRAYAEERVTRVNLFESARELLMRVHENLGPNESESLSSHEL